MVQSSLLSDNFVGRGTRLESTGPLFPFVDLQAQFSLIGAEILDSISAVLEKQHFILGPEVGKLEKELAPLTGCSCAVGCASGSDALLLSLLAMGVGANDEVITTPFTFVATASSIARVNARPVFIDIEPETYNMDVRQLQAAITPRTRAIIPHGPPQYPEDCRGDPRRQVRVPSRAGMPLGGGACRASAPRRGARG